MSRSPLQILQKRLMPTPKLALPRMHFTLLSKHQLEVPIRQRPHPRQLMILKLTIVQ